MEDSNLGHNYHGPTIHPTDPQQEPATIPVHTMSTDTQGPPDTPMPPFPPIVSSLPPIPTPTPTPDLDLNSSKEDSPPVNNSNNIILQWLTYTIWGWAAFALTILTVLVFQRLVAGSDESGTIYYPTVAALLLLIFGFGCDIYYSRNEPQEKTGPAALLTVIYAVVYALTGIGAVLFAAWSIVVLATAAISTGSSVAGLLAAVFAAIFYGATFMRILNPPRFSWLPKIYRYGMVGVIIIFSIVGITHLTFAHSPKPSTFRGTCNPGATASICPGGDNPSSSNNPSSSFQNTPNTSGTGDTFDSNGKLEPAVVGGTQCNINTFSDGSSDGQVAISGNATCSDSDTVTQAAAGKNGGPYTSDGYTCTATLQGANTKWSSYWNNNFYSYNCSKGSDQVAFNWQSAAQSSATKT